MYRDTKRRQSLIPKPQLTSRTSSTFPSPNNSPTKTSPRRVNLSPPSPSKLPIINTRKRPTRSTSDYDLNEIFLHSQTDQELQRQELSGLSFNIDTLLATKYQIESEIRDMERKIEKTSNKIQEYEIGIPYNDSILKEKTNTIEDEIVELQDTIAIEKQKLTKEYLMKEKKFEDELKDVLKDAQEDDMETVMAQEKRITELNAEKDGMLVKIDSAKEKLDLEISNFKKLFAVKRDETVKELDSKKLIVQSLLDEISQEYETLKKTSDELNTQNTLYTEKMKVLEIEINEKKVLAERLSFKLSDIQSLINSLKLDLDASAKLCEDFETGEYSNTKTKWVEAKSKLETEKCKRIKIEIQIKQISGIPNISVLANDKIESLYHSKIAEFIRDPNHEWELELLTALESSLTGISSLVLFCSESPVDLVNWERKLQTSLTKVLSNQDRFGSFEYDLKPITTEDLDSITDQKIHVPSGTRIVYNKMINKDSKTSRQSIILVAHVPTPTLIEQYSPLLSTLQIYLICEDISDTWNDVLCELVTMKPIPPRQAYSLLN